MPTLGSDPASHPSTRGEAERVAAVVAVAHVEPAGGVAHGGLAEAGRLMHPGTAVSARARSWCAAPPCMLMCMHSTSVRIDVATHEELKRLAAELHTTVGDTVSLAVRALRQDRIGAELSAPLRDDETTWLDADLG